MILFSLKFFLNIKYKFRDIKVTGSAINRDLVKVGKL